MKQMQRMRTRLAGIKVSSGGKSEGLVLGKDASPAKTQVLFCYADHREIRPHPFGWPP